MAKRTSKRAAAGKKRAQQLRKRIERLVKGSAPPREHENPAAFVHRRMTELAGAQRAMIATMHGGTIRDRVYAVLRQLGAPNEITNDSEIYKDLNLAPDSVRHALNAEFFPGENVGLSEDQVKEDTIVGTLILEIHELVGN